MNGDIFLRIGFPLFRDCTGGSLNQNTVNLPTGQ